MNDSGNNFQSSSKCLKHSTASPPFFLMPDMQNLSSILGPEPGAPLKCSFICKMGESFVPRTLNLKVWGTENKLKEFVKNKKLVQGLAERTLNFQRAPYDSVREDPNNDLQSEARERRAPTSAEGSLRLASQSLAPCHSPADTDAGFCGQLVVALPCRHGPERRAEFPSLDPMKSCESCHPQEDS